MSNRSALSYSIMVSHDGWAPTGERLAVWVLELSEDGGDSTVTICREWSMDDALRRVEDMRYGFGLGRGDDGDANYFNGLLERSRAGDYVFLDSDDINQPGSLEDLDIWTLAREWPAT